MQHPILTGHDGGGETAALTWEARAQVDLAILIERYLMENPPPPRATHPHLYRAWAADLRLAGEAGLAALGAARLRSA
jgi:hypothetical protein